MEMTGEVTCPMPIVGSRIATLVGDEVERTMHASEAFIDGYLRERSVSDRDPTPHQRAS